MNLKESFRKYFLKNQELNYREFEIPLHEQTFIYDLKFFTLT